MDQLTLCIRCRESTEGRRRYTWASREDQFIDIAQIIIQELLERELEPTAFICRPCWQRSERAHQRRVREETQVDGVPEVNVLVNENELVNQAPQMELPGYVRTPNTGRTCVFLHCENTTRHRIPKNVVLRCIVAYNMLLCDENRVCQEHIQQNQWHELAIQENLRHDFTADQIIQAMTIMRTHISNDVLNFEQYETIDAREFQTWTGRTHAEFTDIITNTPSLNDNKKRTIIAALLVKLRTGDSNARLSVIFITNESTFLRIVKHGLECLVQDFVPLHLEYHITRQNAVQRNLKIPEGIFGNADSPLHERKLITILDGTYIYIQKSSNYFFQRESYSNHKYRNLVKPFLIVCCDGYILDVSGPHPARTSDATIMNNILENENEEGDGLFNWLLNNGDIIIVDRGFRDAVPNLEAHVLTVQMPETRRMHETQLTTEQANKSRLVTMCRWVVEIINGRFKRDFRLLSNIYNNSSLENMFNYFKVAAALTNAFHVVIEDNVHADAFLLIIRERMDLPNEMSDLVSRYNYNRRRTMFRSISAEMPELSNIPRLTEEDLILFSLGSYQLKQASSYYEEHIKDNVSFTIELGDLISAEHARELGENLCIVRGRIQSRHVSAKTYNVYIGFDVTLQVRNAVSHYYCTCNIGKRTLGCYSHVITIVWFVTYARYDPNARQPPAIALDNVFVRPNEH